jgi:hypothetical protein
MKKFLILFVFLGMIAGITIGMAQKKVPVKSDPKVLVYYFHPNDRCPIDQSIEANTINVMKSFFSKETGNGTIDFKVINTDDNANAKITAKFDINAQALYIVKLEKGKEIRKDLTRFAFDYGQSNPGKFKAGLKSEIEIALK